MTSENLFAGAYLDRRAEARLREDWLTAARGDSSTLFVCMCRGAALVRSASELTAAGVAFLSAQDPRVQQSPEEERHILLGWFHEQRCVLRPLVNDLPAAEAGLLAYARALNLWRLNHLHCGRCGAATRATRAGHARQCPDCQHESFPRLDPAIIVLVHDADHALLGRQASWPPNRYSTIAGFVEPGESLEDAVRREVHEETAVTVTHIRYHSSQPWPFPASLMLGFLAQGQRTTPVLRDGELEDAQWFSRTQIQSGAVLLPPHEAISRRLIEQWLAHAQ
jgi:NAD+ diphosphatase